MRLGTVIARRASRRAKDEAISVVKFPRDCFTDELWCLIRHRVNEGGQSGSICAESTLRNSILDERHSTKIGRVQWKSLVLQEIASRKTARNDGVRVGSVIARRASRRANDEAISVDKSGEIASPTSYGV